MLTALFVYLVIYLHQFSVVEYKSEEMPSFDYNIYGTNLHYSNIITVFENIIATTKMRNNFCYPFLYCSPFSYRSSNFGIANLLKFFN